MRYQDMTKIIESHTIFIEYDTDTEQRKLIERSTTMQLREMYATQLRELILLAATEYDFMTGRQVKIRFQK